ncbi:MAG TPA: hypothetical protein ENI57_06730 [Ignavibacteria bacterium]|nr:hypothetical protein [Ignavibacteria bacterium]
MTDIAEKKTEIKFELLHELVVLFGMTRIKNFEYRRGDALGEYTEEQFVVELYPVLSGDAIPDPEVIKWEVRKFFDARIFNWSEKEHRFIEDFKHKLFRPEDLFGKGDVANQIKNMHYYKEIMEKIIPFRKP